MVRLMKKSMQFLKRLLQKLVFCMLSGILRKRNQKMPGAILLNLWEGY
jgi:hypothetical protein